MKRAWQFAAVLWALALIMWSLSTLLTNLEPPECRQDPGSYACEQAKR